MTSQKPPYSRPQPQNPGRRLEQRGRLDCEWMDTWNANISPVNCVYLPEMQFLGKWVA